MSDNTRLTLTFSPRPRKLSKSTSFIVFFSVTPLRITYNTSFSSASCPISSYTLTVIGVSTYASKPLKLSLTRMFSGELLSPTYIIKDEYNILRNTFPFLFFVLLPFVFST